MTPLKVYISDILFHAAVWFDPRLPEYDSLAANDVMTYGTSIVKVIDPHNYFIDPKEKNKTNNFKH